MHGTTVERKSKLQLFNVLHTSRSKSDISFDFGVILYSHYSYVNSLQPNRRFAKKVNWDV